MTTEDLKPKTENWCDNRSPIGSLALRVIYHLGLAAHDYSVENIYVNWPTCEGETIYEVFRELRLRFFDHRQVCLDLYRDPLGLAMLVGQLRVKLDLPLTPESLPPLDVLVWQRAMKITGHDDRP